MSASEPLSKQLNGRRIAIVHEWVDAYAGSEQVFEALAQLLPEADLYALSMNPEVQLDVGGREIKTTFLDRGWLRTRRALTLPMMPLAWAFLGRRGCYDIVITSHHAFAHCNRLARKGGLHLVYVHSPARYVWSPELDERGRSRWLLPMRAILKQIDKRASAKVTAYASNSTAVAERVKAFWGRPSRIIFPPVRVEFFADSYVRDKPRDYVLGFGRWIPYKNLPAVIKAAEAAGLPAVIAGKGPDRLRILQAASGVQIPVDVIECPDDDALRDLYRNAICLVFPTVEDFGMVPVEAQAAGAPVVALNVGGAQDTVDNGRTGLLCESDNPSVLAAAIGEISKIQSADCTSWSRQFSRQSFAAAVFAWVVENAHSDAGSTIPQRGKPR